MRAAILHFIWHVAQKFFSTTLFVCMFLAASYFTVECAIEDALQYDQIMWYIILMEGAALHLGVASAIVYAAVSELMDEYTIFRRMSSAYRPV